MVSSLQEPWICCILGPEVYAQDFLWAIWIPWELFFPKRYIAHLQKVSTGRARHVNPYLLRAFTRLKACIVAQRLDSPEMKGQS